MRVGIRIVFYVYLKIRNITVLLKPAVYREIWENEISCSSGGEKLPLGFVCLLVFVVLGIKPRASFMLAKDCPTEP